MSTRTANTFGIWIWAVSVFTLAGVVIAQVPGPQYSDPGAGTMINWLIGAITALAGAIVWGFKMYVRHNERRDERMIAKLDELVASNSQIKTVLNNAINNSRLGVNPDFSKTQEIKS